MPPPAAPPAAPSLAMREVGLLPPVWLATLPEATMLDLRALDGTPWHVTTGQATYAELREAGALAFTGGELAAIAFAAENGRASSLALAGWLQAKRDEPSKRLDVAGALDGLRDVQCPPAVRWPLSRVLRVCGAELTGVSVGDGALRESM